MTPTHDTLLRSLERILEIDNESLRGTENLQDVGWDSMSVVMLIALAEQDYGVSVPPAKIAVCRTVDDLCRAVLTSPGHASNSD